MKYHTRTVYGDSKETFGGKSQGFIARPQGFGQGNGQAPQNWTALSTRMFEVLHRRGRATSFYTPISLDKLDLCEVSYVDDADMFADADGYDDPDLTVRNMQKTVSDWSGVAKTTGGAIKTEKSWPTRSPK